MFKAYSDRVAERVNAFRARRQRTVFTIFHNVNALKLSWRGPSHDNGEIVVAWKDTLRIEVFKRDMWAADLICLSFITKENKAVEVNEEMDGWDSLVDKLPEYFPGCRTFEDWFQTVAFPAFKTNLTVIYTAASTPILRNVIVIS